MDSGVYLSVGQQWTVVCTCTCLQISCGQRCVPVPVCRSAADSGVYLYLSVGQLWAEKIFEEFGQTVNNEIKK